jgi:hypothetical protein
MTIEAGDERVDTRHQRMLAELSELRAQQRQPAELLPRGGGGGTSGGDMENRVARLEKNVDQLAADVSTMRSDVATLKENVRHLPTKPWMFSALVAMLGALSVIVGLLIRFLPQAG